jgi:1-acyl-sn-glycerol-3-phosphate acyltransferase
MRVLRLLWRVPVMLVLLFLGLAIIGAVFPFIGFRRRDRIIASWSRTLLRTCGVTLETSPSTQSVRIDHFPAVDPTSPRASGTLLVCNHISWLDIFVVLALKPARFVAKIEIAGWPLIGRLVRGAGTLFIERGRRHAVHQLNERIEFTLNAGQTVAIFPEGTTSDGRRLLPFHANLIEPAVRTGAAVIPIGLRYVKPDGSVHEAVDFTGDTSLVSSMLRIFGSSTVMVQVIELAPVHGSTRHAMAAAARAALAEALALPTDDSIPETLQRALGRDPSSGASGPGASS